MTATETPTRQPAISVIIPARNEEANLAACLESLAAQTGVAFEMIVVDDHSTDRTREIAESFASHASPDAPSGVARQSDFGAPEVRVIEADPLPANWTGKNNAVTTGARAARGEWLLFTDADTVHLPGSLARALAEAKENGADLLSYSPEQIAVTFWEMATLPVVFAELARQYPPSKVSDPNSPIVAANGQYILIRREAYAAVGGHAALAKEILEDVALARAVKSSGRGIRFRYAADAVRTRMYRNFAQLREGWTKNLALLFPNPGRLAAKTLLLWAVPWGILLGTIVAGVARRWWWDTAFVAAFLYVTTRLRRANFDLIMEFLGALFGMPMFAYLLLRSKRMHGKGTVPWKGRSYQGKERDANKTADARSNTVMKSSLSIIPLVVLLLVLLPALTIPLVAQSDAAPAFANTLIVPGASVGPLKLGDSRARALELFPQKAEDQQWDDLCGQTLDWIDTSNPMGRGELLIRINKGKIFQIESATTRFKTAEGITTFSAPDDVRNIYRNMHAYTLLTAPVPALGDRPLVFWVDKKQGIAFAFAYDPSRHKRYVYKVIVFEPNKEFCPEQEKTSSPKWQGIAPYSTEPPPELSPERY